MVLERVDFFGGRGEGRRLAIELLDLCKVYMPNISLLLGLEPFKKFSVGGGWWWWVVDTTVNIMFCFGPRLEDLSLSPS